MDYPKVCLGLMNLRRASVHKSVVEAEIRSRNTVNTSQDLVLKQACLLTCKLLSRFTHNPKAASYSYIGIYFFFPHLFTYNTGKFRWYSELIKQGQLFNSAALCLQVMLVSLTLRHRTDYKPLVVCNCLKLIAFWTEILLWLVQHADIFTENIKE